MSETKKKTAAPKPVSKKPYLTGTPLDSSCIGGALRFFLYLLMMAIAFLFLGAVLSFDSFTLRLIINLAVVLLLLIPFVLLLRRRMNAGKEARV